MKKNLEVHPGKILVAVMVKQQSKEGGRTCWKLSRPPDDYRPDRGGLQGGYYTTKEVAEMLGLSHAAVKHAVSRGAIQAVQMVAQRMAYWLQTYARHHCSAKTLDDYERTIRVHIVPALRPAPRGLTAGPRGGGRASVLLFRR